MKEITVSAPGKVHLTSAHIVVYGKPALLCAINLRVTVSIKNENHQGKIIISSNIFKDALTLENKKIKTFTAQAKKSWEEYGKTNNIELIKPLTEPAGFVKIIIGETLAYLKKDLKDVEININSQVPLGANFGGSASVSAALAGALFAYFGHDLNQDEIYQVVYETEKRAHGNPSGGDPAVIIYGGLLWFRKETEFLKLFKQLFFGEKFASANNFLNFPKYLIVNSGKPEESTAEMVHLVKKLVNKRPKYAAKIMARMENYKKQYLLALKKNDINELIRITRADVRDLIKLGAVSEKTRGIIRDLEKLEAGVSVSGAGGQKAGSGALIVLAKDYKAIKEYCTKSKLEFYEVDFQTEGVRLENE